MSKIVIVCEVGNRVFRTLAEASEALGLSQGAISRGISDRGEVAGVRLRRVPRVYALLLMDGSWVIAVENSRGSGYIPLDDGSGVVSKRAVVSKRDLTPVWYYPKEEW